HAAGLLGHRAREPQRAARLLRAVERRNRTSERRALRREEDRNRKAAREGVRMASRGLPRMAARAVQTDEDDLRVARRTRDLRDDAPLDDAPRAGNAGDFALGLEVGDDRVSGGCERAAQLAREIEERLEADRPGEVGDEARFEEGGVEHVDTVDRGA